MMAETPGRYLKFCRLRSTFDTHRWSKVIRLRTHDTRIEHQQVLPESAPCGCLALIPGWSRKGVNALTSPDALGSLLVGRACLALGYSNQHAQPIRRGASHGPMCDNAITSLNGKGCEMSAVRC